MGNACNNKGKKQESNRSIEAKVDPASVKKKHHARGAPPDQDAICYMTPIEMCRLAYKDEQ